MDEELNPSSTFMPKKDLSPPFSDTACSKFRSLKEIIKFYEGKLSRAEQLDQTRLSKMSTYLTSEYSSIQSLRNDCIYNFLIKHEKSIENFKGILYLAVDWRFPLSKIDTIYNSYPTFVQASELGNLISKKIFERKNSESVSQYDTRILKIELMNFDGQALTLRDIPYTYILLDFWSSWCMPCRYENRELKREYAILSQNKNFTIASFSLDTDKKKWIAASIKDSIPFYNLTDLKGYNSGIAEEFKVKSIPYNVLINKDGLVIQSNLWGEDLKNFVRNLK